MELKGVSVVLVGAGNMGGAMLGGWLANGVSSTQLCVLDPNPSLMVADLIDKHNLCHETSADNMTAPDVLLIAVKPQVMGNVMDTVQHLAGKNTVSISVAAGKTLKFMQEHLGHNALVRTMPNTPCMVQRGITVACANTKTTELQKEHTTQLLSAIGSVEWVEDEALIDAVTAVSGSGPAYVFHLAEALGDAGVAAGLPEKLARKLALETIAGAGEMMMQSELTPAILRQNVTSPNGTTQAALEVLMGEGGFPTLLERAVNAAAKRSKELS